MRTPRQISTSFKDIISILIVIADQLDLNDDGDLPSAIELAHHMKNLKVMREYIDTHKLEIQEFISNDKENRG